MKNSKIKSAKEGMGSMAMYYFHALKEQGYSNPKAEMIKGICEVLDLTKEEKYYLYDNNPSVDAKGLCDNIIEMVEDMEKSKAIDVISMRQIKQSIIALKTLIKK